MHTDNTSTGVPRPLSDIAPAHCQGSLVLSKKGCAVSTVEHVFVGLLMLASLCYFACWIYCIYCSKSMLNRKPYNDFKIGNLILRIQVSRPHLLSTDTHFACLESSLVYGLHAALTC